MVAVAERRVALVVGNGKYIDAGLLRNPTRDAEAVAEKLRHLEFSVVLELDADRSAFFRAVQKFADEIEASDVTEALFYYAGHGLQVHDQNFLIPIDAQLTKSKHLDFQTVPLKLIQDQLSREVETGIIVLDACRDNPFSRSLANAIASSRSTTSSTQVGRGLASVGAFRGSFIAFATEPGATADDGRGEANSPFTASLLECMETPGKSISEVMIDVRKRVLERTAGKQTPWDQSNLIRPFQFVRSQISNSSPTSLSVSSSPNITGADEIHWWKHVEMSQDAEDFEDFLRKFPDGFYSHRARKRIDALSRATFRAAGQLEVAVGCQSSTKTHWITPGSGKTHWVRDFSESSELVCIPSGDFLMGSPQDEVGGSAFERPQRKISIKAAFLLGRCVVTLGEWNAYLTDCGLPTLPALHSAGPELGMRHPIVNVSWDEVTSGYLPWLRNKTGKEYRLPTEAEWEFSCRAGSSTAFSMGTSITTNFANFDGRYPYGRTSKGENRGGPVQVQTLPGNEFGLYEMHGNVWEWVSDQWPSDASSSIMKGGSWASGSNYIRSAARGHAPHSARSARIGFRLARSLL